MRSQFPSAVWDTIRKKAYADYGHLCGICRHSGRLNCHEIWEYNDKKRIQTLKGFIALCDWCHHVKHIGHAGILALQGVLDFKKVEQHFMKVNQCTQSQMDAHRKEARELWRERSKHKWKVDLGPYEKSALKLKRRRDIRPK